MSGLPSVDANVTDAEQRWLEENADVFMEDVEMDRGSSAIVPYVPATRPSRVADRGNFSGPWYPGIARDWQTNVRVREGNRRIQDRRNAVETAREMRALAGSPYLAIMPSEDVEMEVMASEDRPTGFTDMSVQELSRDYGWIDAGEFAEVLGAEQAVIQQTNAVLEAVNDVRADRDFVIERDVRARVETPWGNNISGIRRDIYGERRRPKRHVSNASNWYVGYMPNPMGAGDNIYQGGAVAEGVNIPSIQNPPVPAPMPEAVDMPERGPGMYALEDGPGEMNAVVIDLISPPIGPSGANVVENPFSSSSKKELLKKTRESPFRARRKKKFLGLF